MDGGDSTANLPLEPSKPRLTAQDILDLPQSEVNELASKLDPQEVQNMVRDLRFITAILLGKKKNKELAKALDTDKSYTSKQIKSLEEKGLIKKEIEGREVQYDVDTFNVLKFLQSKVVIKLKPLKKENRDG